MSFYTQLCKSLKYSLRINADSKGMAFDTCCQVAFQKGISYTCTSSVSLLQAPNLGTTFF